ncbi:MAG: hypothetical protein J6Y02_14555 [Pseudobutyrivibrio sp.]|nr:hypothetical protein [Pseudobutyrivibrio sp.]
MAEKIVNRNTYEQFVTDYSIYAIYISRRRVTPEYRDGLKPIHRRILYAAYKFDKAVSWGTKVKSAAIVGDVMKTLHPHGDAAIYGAMKPMINWFESKVPLLGNKGNFGSAFGDPAAASRYTEAYVSEFAMDCVISELKECDEAVDWDPNYDGRLMEPQYLPCKVPLLLINGSFSIGLGMKVEIPSHNLAEVIDATIRLIHNPNAPVVLIPDHCQPCEIIESDFKALSNTGQGTYQVRGVIDIGERRNKPCLIIRSVPNLTFLGSVIDKIEDLVKDNKLVQIESLEDASDKNHLEYYIVLKKGTDPNFVREVIYKNTDMQQTCRVNFEVLDGIKPLRMSYRSYLQAFLEFRKLTKFRLYCNRLQGVQTRLHQIDAFIKLLESGEIENIITMIRKQTKDEAYIMEFLIKKLNITDVQAKYILRANIGSLSKAKLQAYKAEMTDLLQKEAFMFSMIHDDDKIAAEIEQELLDIKAKYGRPRCCKVISQKEASDIPSGEFKIIITDNNFIKKIPLNDPIGYFKNTSPKLILKVDNAENILIFDEMGKVFKLPVHKIPFTDKGSNGTDIRILSKNITSNISTVMYEPMVTELSKSLAKHSIVVLTRQGFIKKMDLDDFLAVPVSGLAYSKLDNGDTVIDTMIIPEGFEVIVYSNHKALRMSMNDIPKLLRQARGVRSISNNDSADGLSVITPDMTDIVVLTVNGFANRFSPAALQYTGRYKAGSSVIKLKKNDSIKFICGVNANTDVIRIVTPEEKLEIKVSDIPVGSSIAPGTKIIKGTTILRANILRDPAK